MADAVMRAAPVDIRHGTPPGQAQLQRKVLTPEELPDSMPTASAQTEATQPAAESEEPVVQRSAGASSAATGPAVSAGYAHSVQNAISSGGRTLPATTRSFMESRFQQDFSQVRVHDGAQAAGLARQIDARAFTLGSDIFFGPGEFAPASSAGQRLLAHELTHVVQQSQGRISRQLRRTACSAYPGYDSGVDRLTYNCAGLALRTYKFTSPPSDVYASMNKEFFGLTCPTGTCRAGQVKLWMWEYDIHTEDNTGAVVDPTWRDFHIVGGRMDAAGNEPSVYSKNGRRPIHGPAAGPSFKPAARDRALDTNDNPGDAPNGGPLYKVRSNISEIVTCAGCK